jgi:hypothetical protein
MPGHREKSIFRDAWASHPSFRAPPLPSQSRQARRYAAPHQTTVNHLVPQVFQMGAAEHGARNEVLGRVRPAIQTDDRSPRGGRIPEMSTLQFNPQTNP